MALLFWEGFDSYNDLASLVAAKTNIDPAWYSDYGRWPNYAIGQGRFGTNCIQCNPYNSIRGIINIPGRTDLTSGRAFRLTTDNYTLMGFYSAGVNSSTPDVKIAILGGTVYVYNGQGTLLGAGPAGSSPTNTWHWIEMRAVISTDTVTPDGSVQVWLNNQLIISNLACITKYYSGVGGYVGVNLSPHYGDYFNWLVDDIYILDDTGPAPWNTRLGDVRIATVVPNYDAGPNQGIPSTGVDHYAVVNEIPSTTANYITLPAANTGYGEMFGHTTVSNSAYVLGIAINVLASKSDAGDAIMKLSLQTAGNTYNSSNQYLTTTAAYYRHEWYQSPTSGGQWTVPEWNSANIGVYIV